MIVDQIFQQAIKAHTEGRLIDAEIDYKKVTKLQPDHYLAHSNLGVLLNDLGKMNEAEASTKKAIKLEPEYSGAHFNLGITLNKLGKLDEAELSYKKAIEFKPNYDLAHNNLGNVQNELGKLYEAEKSYRKAIELKPSYAEAHNNLGSILNSFDKFEEAEKSYRKAIELKPDYAEAHINLNLMLRQNEMFSEILKIRKPVANKLSTTRRLITNPFISNRNVEKELINDLYEIKSKGLHETKGVFFGKGRHSLNFELFDQMTINSYSMIKKVEKDLINIMKQSVNSEVYLMDSFFNILKDGGGSVTHTHLNGFDKRKNLVNQKYSLSYYLSTGDQNCSEPGVFKLSDPDKEILPSEGMIIIFPADRAHSAVYNGKTDRVMIGINFYSLF